MKKNRKPKRPPKPKRRRQGHIPCLHLAAQDGTSEVFGHGPFLTDAEVAKLIILVAAGASPSPATEDYADFVVMWARKARVSAAMVDLALNGDIVPAGIREGEPVFRTCEDILSPDKFAELKESLQRLDTLPFHLTPGLGQGAAGAPEMPPDSRQPGTEE